MKTNFRTVIVDAFCPGFMPTRETSKSAGYDLRSPMDFTIQPGEQMSIRLDLTWNPDDPTIFAMVRDKSGLALKSRFTTRAGVIDADYDKEWVLMCVNESGKPLTFERGQKLAQFVLLHYLVADDLETKDTQRDGGFGSTGST